MSTIRMNGSVYKGTPEEIVEQIRMAWMWEPLPTTEELFQFTSGVLKQPIKTAEEYLEAIIKFGIAKVVSSN